MNTEFTMNIELTEKDCIDLLVILLFSENSIDKLTDEQQFLYDDLCVKLRKVTPYER
jgi:hypothetical protein